MGVEMPVEQMADEQADEGSGGNGESHLEHGFGLDEVAEAALFWLERIGRFVRHKSSLSRRWRGRR